MSCPGVKRQLCTDHGLTGEPAVVEAALAVGQGAPADRAEIGPSLSVESGAPQFSVFEAHEEVEGNRCEHDPAGRCAEPPQQGSTHGQHGCIEREPCPCLSGKQCDRGNQRRTGPQAWPHYIPEAHIAYLRGLGLTHVQGGYIFVHAGLRPGVDLAAQTPADLLWIREPFLSFKGELPGVVVHGHTPGRSMVKRPNRIGIDTGAVMGGVLTCLVLEADRMGELRV